MPKANKELARELAKLSTDCSFLLSHLIRQHDGRSDQESKKVLKSILGLNPPSTKPTLKASSVGWYSDLHPNVYNPISGNFDGQCNSKAVCFTESTLSGLKAHRDIFDIKYGIAFDRDLLFERGANPCLNISETLLKLPLRVQNKISPKKVFNFIPQQLHPYINIIHDSFDATHEREWRYAGDLTFSLKEVLFVFCPEKDLPIFSSLQSEGRPVLLDLAWLDRI